MFALIDCNNFYVACETVFDPKLRGKPVLVLSNNDGCIVSRSNKAKKLGIKMGEALFKCAKIVKKNNVLVFSSNYTLYGDMSARVMRTVQTFGLPVEVYSIDEAFVALHKQRPQDLERLAHHMRVKVKRWTGISVSVGIAPTKTLAKIANKIAKKNAACNGTFVIPKGSSTDSILKITNVTDIWGVGRQYTKLLYKNNIYSAFDLTKANDQWVRKKMTIRGLRTVWELRGRPCIDLEQQSAPKQSIACTRSFGEKVTTYTQLKEAVATYTTRAAEKLRKQKSKTALLYVFICTSRFEKNRYFNSVVCTLPEATNYTPCLISAAGNGLKQIYKKGYLYKKAGVVLLDIIADNQVQTDLFEKPANREKEKQMMHMVDIINQKWGKNMVRSAAVKAKPVWVSKKKMRSTQRYTTNWQELLVIKN